MVIITKDRLGGIEIRNIIHLDGSILSNINIIRRIIGDIARCLISLNKLNRRCLFGFYLAITWIISKPIIAINGIYISVTESAII